MLQVSTLSELTRHTASVVATDDESLDSLVVDVVQTTAAAVPPPGISRRSFVEAAHVVWTVGCLSVRLSVCPIGQHVQFAWARAADIGQ